jgi:hypothetical protein
MEQVQSVLKAAEKYVMEGVMNRIQKMMAAPRFLGGELGYLVSPRQTTYTLVPHVCLGICVYLVWPSGWFQRCSYDGRSPISNAPDTGPSLELDHVSPKAYHQLLDYHWRFSTAALRATMAYYWMTSSESDTIPTDVRGMCGSYHYHWQI